MKGNQLGYILNSDMTITSTKQSGKTPIGIVVCSYANGGGQAMALKSVGQYVWYSSYDLNISSLPDTVSAYEAALDISSCANTAKIIATGDKSKFPAAWAAYEYSTTGTKAGDWCLPAAGIYTTMFVNDNTEKSIKKSFKNISNTTSYVYMFGWTSTEDDGTAAWYGVEGVYGDNPLVSFGINHVGIKNRSVPIWPVIEF